MRKNNKAVDANKERKDSGLTHRRYEALRESVLFLWYGQGGSGSYDPYKIHRIRRYATNIDTSLKPGQAHTINYLGRVAHAAAGLPEGIDKRAGATTELPFMAGYVLHANLTREAGFYRGKWPVPEAVMLNSAGAAQLNKFRLEELKQTVCNDVPIEMDFILSEAHSISPINQTAIEFKEGIEKRGAKRNLLICAGVGLAHLQLQETL